MAHEWLVARLGALMGAPVAEGVLIEVDGALVEGHRVDGVALPGGVWFGSKVVSGIESQLVELVKRDGNPQRVPHYLALWSLCLGCDPQFIYEKDADDRLWSIDHGLWFDSLEGDWTAQLLDRSTEISWSAPEWKGARTVDPRALHDAADAVEGITSSDFGVILGQIPIEWDVPDEALEALGQFVHARRGPVAEQLRVQAARLDGRRA